jgi:hypothetical protein
MNIEGLIFNISAIKGINITYIYPIRDINDKIIYASNNNLAANILTTKFDDTLEKIKLYNFDCMGRIRFDSDLYRIIFNRSADNIVSVDKYPSSKQYIENVIDMKGLQDGYKISLVKDEGDSDIIIEAIVPVFKEFSIDGTILAIRLAKEFVKSYREDFTQDALDGYVNKFNDIIFGEMIKYNNSF